MFQGIFSLLWEAFLETLSSFVPSVHHFLCDSNGLYYILCVYASVFVKMIQAPPRRTYFH